MAVHKQTRDSTCARNPALANGLENCEHIHHMLQTGFGMAAARRTYGGFKNHCIRGIVVTACSDAVHTMDVPLMYAAVSLFEVPHASPPRAKPKPRRARARVVARPHRGRWTAARAREVCAAYGFHAAGRTSGPLCVLRSASGGPGKPSELCCALLSTPWHKIPLAAKKKITASFRCGPGFVRAVASPGPGGALEVLRIP